MRPIGFTIVLLAALTCLDTLRVDAGLSPKNAEASGEKGAEPGSLGAAAGGFPGPPVPLPGVDEVYPEPIDWSGKRVLHIGDSHVSRGLISGLRKRVRRAGGRYRAETWVGSRSKSWVASGRLRREVEEYHPQIVIVTLGGNAIRNPHPHRFEPWIRALVEKIGPRRCFWIGPPSSIPDRHGLNEVLRSACRPCRYFETRRMELEAPSEWGVHLPPAQGRRWADRVWSWMNGEDAL
jgi:hypothetical protein